MGNTTSSEAPRKASQRLSKPRAASHGALPRPQNPAGAAASSSTRISESYLAASLPFSCRDSQCIASGGDAAQEPYLERLYEPSRRLSRRESDYMRSPVLPSPVLPESPVTNTRSHSLYANSTASNQMRRTSSVMNSEADRPLTRTQSWHGNRMERGRSMQSELLQFYASQPLPRSSSEFLQELQAAAMNSQADMRQSRRASSVAAAGASLPRTTSDLSFYAPARRRSVVRTPGVATRPRRESMLVIPDRTSSRKSQPVFGDDPYTFKASSKAPKHISMPPMPVGGFGPLERAVTPCESDYKQLGGIKFGSLKIMNGSPPSSPQDQIKQQQIDAGTEVAPDDAGIELNMARRKHRHTVIGSGAESRALASVSGFNLGGDKTAQPLSQMANPLDDLMPSPLSKAPSPLLGYPDMDDTEGASGKGMGGVRRSNSGFGSLTSSESSQRTSSKTDSGYSSNASERSFLSSQNTDDSSYFRPHPTRRRTVDHSSTATPMMTADGTKRTSKLYKSYIRLDGNGAAASDKAKEAMGASAAFTKPKASKRHEKRLPSHRMDASSATLNTIMSVDNLVPSDSAPSSHHVSEAEAAAKDGPKPLKKRRSLRKVAEAATSRMPSLNLGRRRSAAGDVASSRAEVEKRKRALSLANTSGVSAAASKNHHNSPYLVHSTPPAAAISSPPPPPPPPPPSSSSKTPDRGGARASSSLKDRASAPDLRVAIPDHTPLLSRGSTSRASYSTVGTPSPRTPRARGIMDSGVPPPIPPQFRAPNFSALPALAIPNNHINNSSSSSPGWPLAHHQGVWNGAQMQQQMRRSPAGHHRVLESPISPRHHQPVRGAPPTYRGVRI